MKLLQVANSDPIVLIAFDFSNMIFKVLVNPGQLADLLCRSV